MKHLEFIRFQTWSKCNQIHFQALTEQNPSWPDWSI